MDTKDTLTAGGAATGVGAGLLGNALLRQPSGYDELAALLREQAAAAKTVGGWATRAGSLRASGALGRALEKLGPRGYRALLSVGRFAPATALPVAGGLLGAAGLRSLVGNAHDRNSLRS